MAYRGSCHCGRIAFEVEGEIGKLTECNCSICTKRGALLWFVPRESFKLQTPQADVATYRFGKGRIAHRFCPHCGCAPYSEGTDPHGKPIAAVNARCLDGVDLGAFERVQFDGRSL